MAMAMAASAVPRRAWVMLRVFMLASSHRNNGDTISTGDTNYRTGRNRRSARNCLAESLAEAGHGLSELGLVSTGRDGAALEARHVAAGREGSIGIDRTIGDGEQHLPLLRRVGIRRDLDVAGRDRALELGGIIGDRAERQRQRTHALRDRNLLGDARSDLQRDVGKRLNFGLAMVILL